MPGESANNQPQRFMNRTNELSPSWSLVSRPRTPLRVIRVPLTGPTAMTLCLIACACIAADGTARKATPRVESDTPRIDKAERASLPSATAPLQVPVERPVLAFPIRPEPAYQSTIRDPADAIPRIAEFPKPEVENPAQRVSPRPLESPVSPGVSQPEPVGYKAGVGPKAGFDTYRLPALEPVQFVPTALPESVDTGSRAGAEMFTLPPIQAVPSIELAPTVLFDSVDTGIRAGFDTYTLPPIQSMPSIEFPRF